MYLRGIFISALMRIHPGTLELQGGSPDFCSQESVSIATQNRLHCLPEGLFLRPKLLSLLVDLTLHLQFNLAQLMIMRNNSTSNNRNKPFLLLGAIVLP